MENEERVVLILKTISRWGRGIYDSDNLDNYTHYCTVTPDIDEDGTGEIRLYAPDEDDSLSGIRVVRRVGGSRSVWEVVHGGN